MCIAFLAKAAGSIVSPRTFSKVTKIVVCSTLVAIVANEVFANTNSQEEHHLRRVHCACNNGTSLIFDLNDNGEDPAKALVDLFNKSVLDGLKECICYIPNVLSYYYNR